MAQLSKNGLFSDGLSAWALRASYLLSLLLIAAICVYFFLEQRDKNDEIKHRIGVVTGKEELKLTDDNLVPKQGGQGGPNLEQIIAQNFPFYSIETVDLAGGAEPIDDGLVGQQIFAGEATRLAYMTDEAVEGRDSFLEKRKPDWSDFPYYY